MEDKKNSNIKIKILVDFVMIIFMLLLMNIRFIGIKLHEVFGLAVFFLFAIHKFLNLKTIKYFFKNIFHKKVTGKNKISFLLDIILLFIIIGIMVTGILISNYVFKDIFIGNVGVLKKIHKFLSWWFFVLISIHLGFHLNTIFLLIKRKLKVTTKFIPIISVTLFLFFSLNGMRVLVWKNGYKNFLPNFHTNHYGRLENDKRTNLNNNGKRKYKNRINKMGDREHTDIHLLDVSSIMVLFSGGTYFLLKGISKRQ